MFGRFSTTPLIDNIRQISAGLIAEELVVSVSTARVVCANYNAIIHDFPQIFGVEALRDRPLPGCPQCHKSGRLCRSAINTWLINNAGFISKQQVTPNSVNSQIEVGGVVKTAFRPPVYGRAVVVPVDVLGKPGSANFLDLKGAGVAPGVSPSQAPYSTGLEYLGQAIADFFYGWLVDTVFARTFPGYHVVPVYAVLDYGFDIVNGWHGTAPAGVHVRRAHSRPVPKDSLPMSGTDRERLMLHAELLLRLFGLTTAGLFFKFADEGRSDELLYNDQPIVSDSEPERQMEARIRQVIHSSGGDGLEALNMQLTCTASWDDKTLQMYDFGHVRAVRHFTNAISNPIRNGALSVGRIITPKDANFVQPQTAIAVDPELCSRRSVNAYGFYAAQAFRNQANSFDQKAIETMLRIGRLKAFRRDFEWAHEKALTARANPRQNPVECCTA
jgi:hypothetical protein